jgi:hypothetical protein
MKRLLRTLFTIRGLILAGTLTLAAVGSYYLDQGTAASVAGVHSHGAAHLHAVASNQPYQTLAQLRNAEGTLQLSVTQLSTLAACAQPGYGAMLLCPLWH